MTRFERFASDVYALAELLKDAAALDPYCEDSPWMEDGYETCEEWLRAEEGEKGTYPWRNRMDNKPIEESMFDILGAKALLNLFSQPAPKFDGKTVEFAPLKKLGGTEK